MYRNADHERLGVIWACVSDDKGQTVEGQVHELRAVASRMGVRVPDEYVFALDDELAHSRWKGDPPEKKEVLDLAHRRKFDVLFIWALDRWSRRRKDGAREIFDVLPAHGVTVFSHQEPFLSTESIPDVFREQIGNVILWLAEEDSKRKSERVKLRYRTNRNRAAAGGGKAKWGRGTIATPAERDEIHRLRVDEGLGGRAIARRVDLPKSTVYDILDDLSER